MCRSTRGTDRRRKPFPTPHRRGRKWPSAAGVILCATGLLASATLAGSATASFAALGGPRFVRIGSAPRLAGAMALGPVVGSRKIVLDVALRPRDPPPWRALWLASRIRLSRIPPVPAPGSLRVSLWRNDRYAALDDRDASQPRPKGRIGKQQPPFRQGHLSAAVAERAFDTTIERYRLKSGDRVWANLSAPRIPASIAGGVQAIIGLDDLALVHSEDIEGPRPAVRRSFSLRARSDLPGPQPCLQAASEAEANGGPYGADEIAASYGFSDLYDAGDFGAGVTVAVFELEPFDQSSVRSYDECYFGTAQGAAMSSPPSLKVVTVDGAQSGLATNEDIESTLDVEEVSGFVPGATIEVYEGPNTNVGPLDVWNAIFTADTAKVITTSWGTCEAQDGGSATVAAEANLFEQAAAQGETVVAASGDSGSSD